MSWFVLKNTMKRTIMMMNNRRFDAENRVTSESDATVFVWLLDIPKRPEASDCGGVEVWHFFVRLYRSVYGCQPTRQCL